MITKIGGVSQMDFGIEMAGLRIKRARTATAVADKKIPNTEYRMSK
jgi:hypothetical protein